MFFGWSHLIYTIPESWPQKIFVFSRYRDHYSWYQVVFDDAQKLFADFYLSLKAKGLLSYIGIYILSRGDLEVLTFHSWLIIFSGAKCLSPLMARPRHLWPNPNLPTEKITPSTNCKVLASWAVRQTDGRPDVRTYINFSSFLPVAES